MDFNVCEQIGPQRHCALLCCPTWLCLAVHPAWASSVFTYMCSCWTSAPEKDTLSQTAQFAMQILLKVTIDFLSDARAEQWINNSIFTKLSLIKNISQVAPHCLKHFLRNAFFSQIAWKLPSASLITSLSLMSSWSPDLAIQLPKISFQSVISFPSWAPIALIHVLTWTQDSSSWLIRTPDFRVLLLNNSPLCTLLLITLLLKNFNGEIIYQGLR